MFGAFGELPKDLPEEKLREKVEELEDKCRKVGLYLNGVALNIDQGPQDEEDTDPIKAHSLLVQFGIGDVAFSKRIQDPEQDKMDDEFRVIAAADVDDDMERIRQQYLKGQDEDSTEPDDQAGTQGSGSEESGTGEDPKET